MSAVRSPRCSSASHRRSDTTRSSPPVVRYRSRLNVVVKLLSHLFKFGAQFLRYQQNNFDPGNEGTLGIFEYSGQFTANPAMKATGYSYADFVLDRAIYAGIGGVRGYTGQRQWRDGKG